MAPVRIVTDNACDLPAELVTAHDVVVVPLDVRLGDKGAEELKAVTPEQFWELAKASPALASTSAPAPGAFAAAFAAAREEGCAGCVCVTLSSRLSATHQAALSGAQGFGDFPLAVVDSRSVTCGEGILVLDAAEGAEAGWGVVEITEALRRAIGSIEVFGTLDTLEYLRRGGRIGSAQTLLGSLLSIKPVVEVRDGVVEAESKQRTRGRSLEYLARRVDAAGPLRRLAVAHAAAADVETLLVLLEPIYPRAETIVSYIGPVIGAHTGPGTIGVCLERSGDSPAAPPPVP